MAFGPAYTYMLLRLVYGQRWSETEAPRALAVYCLYILLLAVNGILEAFVHAVANSRCACTFLLFPCACTLPMAYAGHPRQGSCERPHLSMVSSSSLATSCSFRCGVCQPECTC